MLTCMQDEKIPTYPRFGCCSVRIGPLKTPEDEKRKDHATAEAKERDREIGDISTLEECIFAVDVYLTAPTVKPAMKRSRNRLYMKAMGRLAIRQAAISAPQ